MLASGTKALGGTDRDLWGYVATNDTPIANAVMDLMAMRGGILDWRRAEAIASGLDAAERGARPAIGHRQPRRRVPGRAPGRDPRCSIRRCPVIPTPR